MLNALTVGINRVSHLIQPETARFRAENVNQRRKGMSYKIKSNNKKNRKSRKGTKAERRYPSLKILVDPYGEKEKK